MIGKYHGLPYHDITIKKWLITFEVDEPPLEYDKHKDKVLTIEVKEKREKRSLSANAYFHVLVDKIAEVQNVSHVEIKNQLIARYGFMDEDIKNIIMDDEIPWEKVESMHLRPTTATKVMDNGKLYRVYIVMRGSHTYDTKEMARLIDGTVSEAKELEIPTMTEKELERMKQLWEAS